MATPDDITSLFSDNRAGNREAANRRARDLEEDYALNHSVEAYGDSAPEGAELVGSETAWQNLESHLREHRPLLNDQSEWRANYAEMDAKDRLARDAARFDHLRWRGNDGHGRER